MVSLVSCVSPQANHSADLDRAPSSEFSLNGVGDMGALYYDRTEDGVPVREDLSFAELKAILERERFSRIEDLLEHLNKIKPEYMSRYTLMHDSRSLHESSKTHPRAIVFGKTGNFIITFNGHPTQRAYEMLEVSEFNHNLKKFEYREIEFRESQTSGLPYKISGVGGPDGKCLMCHTNSRPIWEYYPKWPGAFGEDDDSPIAENSNHAGDMVHLNHPKSGIKKSIKGENSWHEYQQKHSKVGRYRFLNPLAKSRVVEYYASRPNTDLTAIITNLNVQRIGRILKQHVTRDFRHAYLFAVACVPYGEPFAKEHRPHGFDQLVSKYKVRYDQDALAHETYRTATLIKNLYNEAEVLRNWESIYTSRGDTIPFDKSDNLLRATEKVLVKEKRRGKIETDNIFASLAALTEEFFPEAQVPTWSSSLYENVLTFVPGTGTEMVWMQEDTLKALFTKSEIATIMKDVRADHSQYCREIIQHMPAQLR